MIKAPCKGCTDRFYDDVAKRSCHSGCKKYAAYQKECEQRRVENHQRASFNSYKYDNVPRLKRTSPYKLFRSERK